MRILIFTFLFFAAWMARAEGICIRLESISIGCVPSLDHPCIRNKNVAVDGANAGKCVYFPDPDKTGNSGAFLPPGKIGTMDPNNTTNPNSDAYYDKTTAAQAGPIAWNCQTWESGGPCPPGGDVSTCPSAKCVVYYQPVCKNKCTWCIKDPKYDQAHGAGCIVCTRPYCEQDPNREPRASVACGSYPLNPDGTEDKTYALPNRGYPKCPSVNPPACPDTERIPGGVRCKDGQGNDITITNPDGSTFCPVAVSMGEECQPRQKVDSIKVAGRPEQCPWIVDVRTYDPPKEGPPKVPGVNHCEPVKIGNRFPGDCCKCRKATNQTLEDGSACSNGCGPLPPSFICPDAVLN